MSGQAYDANHMDNFIRDKSAKKLNRNSEEYKELFKAMIHDWRLKWNDNFPFYYVQIAPYSYNDDLESHQLREAQRKTVSEVEKTGMVVTMDIGDEFDIHPRKKKEVGNRLALLALKNTYERFEINAAGPLFTHHENHQGFLKVFFENVGEKLTLESNESNDFEVSGIDGKFFPAKAIVKGDYLKVFSDSVPYPTEIRYGWKNWTKGSLFNSAGLPASSFNSISDR